MSKDTSISEIWKDWCRLCGHHDMNSGKSISLKNNSEIGKKILKYLSLQNLYDENLPENICLECDEKVSQFDLFALRCEKIQTTFIETLSLQHIKCDTEADIAKKSTAFDPEVTKNTPNEADDLKIIGAIAADDNGKPIREDGNLSKSVNDVIIKDEISDQSEDSFSDRDLPFDNDRAFKMRKKRLRSNIKSVLKEMIKTDDTKSFILHSKKSVKKKVKSSFLKYDCHICHEDCRNWHALCIHFRDVHNARAKVMCVCGKFLASRVSIGRHCAKHGKVDSFTCPSCSKRFPRASELEAHQVSHLPIEQRPFVCCKCARRFTSNQLLRHHERMHIPINQRLLHPCDVCNTKFATKSGLAMHIRAVHERLRPFVCDQCGRTFTTKGILEEHQVRHSDARPHQCDTCNKSFKTKQRLAIHADTHGNTVYQCPHCPVKLNSRRTLRMHLFVHDEVCRYRCSFCEKAFKRAKDLKNHHNLHTGRRPYICPWCARSFANGSNCRAHKRRMHPVELAEQEAASLSASNVTELSESKPALTDTPKVIYTTVKRKTPLKPITQPKSSEVEIAEKEDKRNALDLKNLKRESIKEELISPSEQNEHATQKILGYPNSELSIIPIVESAKENEDEMRDEAMHVPIIVTSFGKGGQVCPYLRDSGNESLFMANSFFGKE